MKYKSVINRIATQPKNLVLALLWSMTVLPFCHLMISVASVFGGVTLSPREQRALQAGYISTATANPILTTIAVKYMQDATRFVGSRLAPWFFTTERSANYYVLDAADTVSVPELKPLAPGSHYGRSALHLSDDTYSCKKFGHEVPVADEEAKKYGRQLDADKAAVNRNLSIIRINHERRVYAAATNPDKVITLNPATVWNGPGSTPDTDIDTLRSQIDDTVGMPPDTIVLSRAVWDVVKRHPAFRSLLGEVNAIKILTLAQFAEIIEIPNVLIAGGAVNAAADGQAVQAQKIWGASVVLACTNTAQDLQALNFLRTFVWTTDEGGGEGGIAVKSYREENADSVIHQIKHFTDEKLVGAGAGAHLAEVLV